MAVSSEQVLAALRAVRFPGFERDVVELGVVASVVAGADSVRVTLRLPQVAQDVASAVERAVVGAVAALPGAPPVRVEREGRGPGASSLPMAGPATPPRPSVAAQGGLDSELIPGVTHTVAVASGKGGVGKSTVAVNLAVALAAQGARTGLLDADIYGPSIPLMMGATRERPRLEDDGRHLVPFERHGVRFMSLGFLVDPEQAVIWRGPMVMKAIEQLLRDVSWGELDVLVVDMPPGTGDAQLTMSQRVSLAGAVIVTTPQDVALADAIKGVAMFRKVGVPVLGVVENMSFFVCPHCSGRTEVFGHGGGRRQAERLGVPFLGEIPLDPAIRVSGDEGTPVTAAGAETPQARAFRDVAARVLEALPSGADPAGPGAGLFERFKRLRKRD